MIKRALEAAQLRRENESLKQKSEVQHDLVGSSAPVQQLKQMLERAAPTNSRILITGEAGTGKDVKVAVFAQGDNAEKAKAAGADIVGFEDLAESIQGGNLDFERSQPNADLVRCRPCLFSF